MISNNDINASFKNEPKLKNRWIYLDSLSQYNLIRYLSPLLQIK